MTAEFSILTVCTGNIHRSPFAAALVATWAGWYLPPSLAEDVRVRSAGFGAAVGAPMGRRAAALVSAFGGDGSRHIATQITDQLISGSDLVLTATRKQRDEVLARVPAALRRTFTIREAGRVAETIEAPLPTSIQHLRSVVELLADSRTGVADGASDDIIDPQGSGDEAYLQMASEEVAPLARLAAVMFGMPRPDLDAYLAAGENPALALASATKQGRM